MYNEVINNMDVYKRNNMYDKLKRPQNLCTAMHEKELLYIQNMKQSKTIPRFKMLLFDFGF